jgi:hypothetical protein
VDRRQVWVDAGEDLAGGMYLVESVTFLAEDPSDPDELT